MKPITKPTGGPPLYMDHLDCEQLKNEMLAALNRVCWNGHLVRLSIHRSPQLSLQKYF
jgi:hypothetical protein